MSDPIRAYRLTQQRRDYLQCGPRQDWMTDEQWRQIRAYVEGREIPTDSEVIEGLLSCGQSGSRMARWAYHGVSSCVVFESNYTAWCKLIRAHTMDTDLLVDEGL